MCVWGVGVPRCSNVTDSDVHASWQLHVVAESFDYERLSTQSTPRHAPSTVALSPASCIAHAHTHTHTHTRTAGHACTHSVDGEYADYTTVDMSRPACAHDGHTQCELATLRHGSTFVRRLLVVPRHRLSTVAAGLLPSLARRPGTLSRIISGIRTLSWTTSSAC